MDFWIDVGIAALLRLLKDRRSVHKYFEGLAKLHVQMDRLKALDTRYAEAYNKAELKT